LTKAFEETAGDGIKRRGLVLSYLMRFKQICNHPDQYLGTGGFEEKRAANFKGFVKSAKPSMKKEKNSLCSPNSKK